MIEFKLMTGRPCPDSSLNQFGAGEKAVIDSFGGLIPCVVKRVVEPGRGLYATEGKIEVEVTKKMAGYSKGEIVERPASKVVPVKHVIRGQYKSTVNVYYKWA
jgi:hypothetical protein